MDTALIRRAKLDVQTIKSRQKETWEMGDFGQVAKYNEPAAEQFMAHLPLQRGAKVLDVACGTGNLALIAARKGCLASGIDIASNLIVQARERAAAEGLTVDFQEADAEALPFATGSFDAVVSMFGVMFAPRPKLAAAELLRVTKPGGIIALANWTPEGFIGRLFDVFNMFVPPTPGVPSPLLWGKPEMIHSRLVAGVSEFQFCRRIAPLCYPFSAAGTVEFFRRYYGPTQRAFAALDQERQIALRRQLEFLQCEHNVSNDPHRTETPAEYLQVIAHRRRD